MFSKLVIRSIIASAVLGLALAFSAGPAPAGDTTCGGPKQPPCPPPPCNPAKEKCDLCHNIGGPNALGANCDAGNCKLSTISAIGDSDLLLQFVIALILSGSNPEDNDLYGGIVVPFGDAAFDAHFNHGDGFTLVEFDRIHDTQPHVAANVGCFALRHDPDPGN